MNSEKINRKTLIGSADKISFAPKRIFDAASWLGVSVVCLLSLMYSGEIKAAVLSGLRLGATVIVPSVFPFMIFADYYSSHASGGGIIGRTFCRLFGISERLGGAFICGNIFGFPIGVRMAERLYEGGAISKSELEDSIGLLNNPSIVFVLCASSFVLGENKKIIPIIAVLSATFIVGMIFRRKTAYSLNYAYNPRQRFDLSHSIRDAALSCVGICAYISFFSAAIALVKIAGNSDFLSVILAPFLEVGTAVDVIGKSALDSSIKCGLLAFSLGFSGLSVHMQAFGILPEKISKRKYFLMKTCEGAIAFLICIIIDYLVS